MEKIIKEALDAARSFHRTEPCAGNLPVHQRFIAAIEKLEKAAEARKVWVLVVDQKHGTEITVHRTQEGAGKAIFAYCDQFWAQQFAEDRPPDDELVRVYWDRQSERGDE